MANLRTKFTAGVATLLTTTTLAVTPAYADKKASEQLTDTHNEASTLDLYIRPGETPYEAWQRSLGSGESFRAALKHSRANPGEVVINVSVGERDKAITNDRIESGLEKFVADTFTNKGFTTTPETSYFFSQTGREGGTLVRFFIAGDLISPKSYGLANVRDQETAAALIKKYEQTNGLRLTENTEYSQEDQYAVDLTR